MTAGRAQRAEEKAAATGCVAMRNAPLASGGNTLKASAALDRLLDLLDQPLLSPPPDSLQEHLEDVLSIYTAGVQTLDLNDLAACSEKLSKAVGLSNPSTQGARAGAWGLQEQQQ